MILLPNYFVSFHNLATTAPIHLQITIEQHSMAVRMIQSLFLLTLALGGSALSLPRNEQYCYFSLVAYGVPSGPITLTESNTGWIMVDSSFPQTQLYLSNGLLYDWGTRSCDIESDGLVSCSSGRANPGRISCMMAGTRIGWLAQFKGLEEPWHFIVTQHLTKTVATRLC